MQGSFLAGLCFLLSLSGAEAQVAKGPCNRCPLHGYCVNSTHCTCNPGFISGSGKRFFTYPLEKCKDIDECKPPISIYCGLNAECKNVEGSFHCRCVPGYELLSGDVQFNNSNENTCQNITSSKTPNGHTELQQIVNNFESLLTNQTFWGAGSKQEVASTASSILQNVESKVLETALRAPGQKIQKVQNSTVAVETRVVSDNCSKERKAFRLHTQMNSVDIHCIDVIQGRTQGPSAVAFISYASLGNILNATFFEKADEKDPLYLNSQVVSAAVAPRRNSSLSQSVTLTFQNLKMKPSSRKAFCVYWKITEAGGHWSRDGCFLTQVNQSHTVCSSTHLSSFAVLVAFTSQDDDPVLSVITCVGLGVSLLCLVLAALTFLLCRAIQNTSTSLHLQLSLCLLLAHLLFLTAIDRTQPKVPRRPRGC
ncbi:adhesion G protein-coupled receptor E3 [Marmota marmota marmota]|uniref:adhesion G protein-coupled receptor E3 n=1 Tax=Marmota marmota marmota TaxID=9994 RepID=UPI000762983B|nr:adhesion G protein-coupled receptor E3 [Marmota marmota marmota]